MWELIGLLIDDFMLRCRTNEGSAESFHNCPMVDPRGWTQFQDFDDRFGCRLSALSWSFRPDGIFQELDDNL